MIYSHIDPARVLPHIVDAVGGRTPQSSDGDVIDTHLLFLLLLFPLCASAIPAPRHRSSWIPLLIASREIPVARETAEMPPHPIAIASLSATSRRARSFSSPLTSSNLRLITSSSLMPHSLS